MWLCNAVSQMVNVTATTTPVTASSAATTQVGHDDVTIAACDAATSSDSASTTPGRRGRHLNATTDPRTAPRADAAQMTPHPGAPPWVSSAAIGPSTNNAGSTSGW